jgi:polyhydroxyalkanoate synthesis regulator phasin
LETLNDKNRGPDVITDKERAKRLSLQLQEADVDRSMLKSEIADLKNQVKVLREKNTPELLKEIDEKFADQKGVLDSKKLQKISMEAGKNLIILAERYNSILQEAVERGKPVPFGTYILTKPELKLVPIRIMVDFNNKRIWVELWEKRLQRLSR